MKKLFILALLPLVFAGCAKKEGQGLPEAKNEYVVEAVQYSTADMNTSYPATIRGKEDIEIRPKIAGFITKVCVDEGQAVHAGQVLFVLDKVQYQEAVRQAEAQINVLRTNIASQELTISNKQYLFDHEIISQYDLQVAKNTLESRPRPRWQPPRTT